MNARELAGLMADNAQLVAEHLLPNGRKMGKEWKVGSTGGEEGRSMSVCVGGAKRGVWKDFDSGDSGDLLDLWGACRALSVADAMREARQFLGVRDDMPKREAPTYKRPERPRARRATSVLEDWFASRGLSMDTVNAFKVVEQPRGEAMYIVFPYLRGAELINAKYRNIADKKDMRQEAGAEPCLYGWDLVAPSCRTIAIAEGELDAMTLHQAGIPALSVNAGAGNHQWIDNDWETGQQADRINYVNGLLSLAGSERAQDAVSANNLLDKYSNQIVARLGQGGLGTDAARAILQSAYPNAHMTVPAINEAADNLIGANQMVQAKTRLLAPIANQRDPSAYNNAEMKFDQNADPRIFQYANIQDPVARQAFAKKLMQQDPKIQNKIQNLQSMGAFQ